MAQSVHITQAGCDAQADCCEDPSKHALDTNVCAHTKSLAGDSLFSMHMACLAAVPRHWILALLQHCSCLDGVAATHQVDCCASVRSCTLMSSGVLVELVHVTDQSLLIMDT